LNAIGTVDVQASEGRIAIEVLTTDQQKSRFNLVGAPYRK
jgi:hypothetical protein